LSYASAMRIWMYLRFAPLPLLFAVVALASGCGARSTIDDAADTPILDAGRIPPDADASKPPPPHDAAPDVTPPDADAAPQCPATCDDNVDCTVDSCDAKTLACTHRPDDSLCPNGLKCDGIDGCQKPVHPPH